VQVWDGNSAGGCGLGGCAGQVRARSLRVRGGNGQDFSNFCVCGADLKFAGAGRECIKNFNPRSTLTDAI